MSVKEKFIGDVVVLVVSGKLMGGNETWEIHEKVKLLISEGIKKIIINLSAVKWLNSQGLGMLISSMTSLQNSGGYLKISGATKKVNSLFMMTRLVTVFSCYESVDEAVKAFKEM